MRLYFWTLIFLGAVCTISCTNREKLNHPDPKEFAELYPEALESGFAWPQVVSPNDKIDFFISTQNENPQLSISRFKTENLDNNKVIKKVKFKPNSNNRIHTCTVVNGCQWESNLSLVIENDWESGLYIAQFLDSKKQKKYIYFFVKNEKKKPEFLFLYDWTTLNAYNFFGGQNVYVRLKDSNLYQTASLNKDIPGIYSLKRPMFPKNHIFERKDGKHIAKFHDGTKLIFYGTDPLEVLYELGKEGHVLPNDFNLMNNDIELDKYKVVILPSYQEYLDLNFLNRIRAYVKDGGRLIIMAAEFAYRRIRSMEDSFSFYMNPEADPFFGKDNSKVASDFASQVVIRDYFGHAVEYGRSFAYFSKNREFRFFEKDHPLTKIMQRKKIKIREGWMPGSILRKQKNGKYCVETKAFSCEDQIVFGSFIHKNTEKETCCLRHPELDVLYDGVADKVAKEVSETIYMPVYYAKYGKGHLFVAPEAYFFTPNTFFYFYKAFMDFSSQK